MTDASIQLPAARSSPSAARRFVTEKLPPTSGVAEITLCVSELVSNAILHAGTGCVVRLHDNAQAVRVEVRDQNPHVLPVKREYDATSVTGRGLQLIDRLTSRWGVDVDADGKTVWFEVPASGESTKEAS
jgi:anti-sigma regulatory factor (Ser/Thr protein kinase)